MIGKFSEPEGPRCAWTPASVICAYKREIENKTEVASSRKTEQKKGKKKVEQVTEQWQKTVVEDYGNDHEYSTKKKNRNG